MRPLSVDPNRISESVGHRRITVRVRFPRIAFLFACAVSLALPLAAQSPNGTINGRVVDPSNGVIAGADILVINDATGVKYSGKTNDDGIYVVPNLPPGPYRLQVSKVGFKTLIKPDIVLNIQDALSINFTLPVGAVFETVTVEGGAPMVNTTDASVSTVMDQNYVENMPLNGRSFQDLILLTPGVVTQKSSECSHTSRLGQTGEFSVNGQRPESNYYTVDGVSANVGAAAGSTHDYERRVLVALFLQRRLWGQRRLWFPWMIFRNFACRVRLTRRNTGAIRAGSSRLRRNRARINGMARRTTICGTALSTPTTGSTTILVRRNLPFGRMISAVHSVGRSKFPACITEKTRRSSLSPMRGCA